MHGKLISFEGIDGCGKTTAIRSTQAFLETQGINSIITRQPGGTKTGEQIRHLLLHCEEPLCKISELLLFCASFAQSIEILLKPTLEKGTWVLADRYTDSTRAYQGAGRGISHETIDTILKEAVENHPLHIPSKTFLLDITPETAWRRMEKDNLRTGPDKIEAEGIGFQRKVRERYLQLAQEKSDRFHIVDCENLNRKEVAQTIANEITKLLPNQKNH